MSKERKWIRNMALLAAVFSLIALVVAAPVPAFAAARDDVCQGVGLAGGGSGCVDPAGRTVDSVVRVVISILSYAVGVAAVIMLIIAGLKYVTANGDSGSISSAKNTIIYALVGIVIAALAQVIVRYVLDKL